jgi:phosphopantetheinyl transferase
VDQLVNVYFDVPNRFYQVRRDPLNGWLGRPQPALQRPGLVLWEMENLSADFCAQSAGIFLRMLAHCVLGFDELDEWRALGKGGAQRRQWLLGRVCIKEAVRSWVHSITGELLYPSDVVVMHDTQGKPYVDGWWRDTLIGAPEISLAHNERACLAAVSEPERAVGVDLEDLGRVQRPDLLLASFVATEQAFVGAMPEPMREEAILRIWCAKEAAAKLLGTGLQGQPENFEVSFSDAAMQAATVQCGDLIVEVAAVRENISILALAQGWHRSVKVY